MKARWQEAAQNHTLGMGGQPAGNTRRKTPREQTVPSEVMVPLLQAVITGVLLTLLPPIVYGVFRLIGLWAAVWAILVSIVILTVWCWLVLRANRPLLWSVEEFMQPEQAKAGEIKTVIQGEIKEGRGIKRPEFPGDLAALRQFARALVDGRARFSEAEALRFGYKDYEDLRALFFNNDWASWRNPAVHQQGVEMGLNGQGVLELLAKSDE